jgi:hypothetical protein
VKIIECEQGSAEWKAARAGVITASMFSLARKRVGGLNEQQQVYVDAIRGGKPQAEAMALANYKAKPKAEVIEKALDGQPVGDFSDAGKDYAFRLAVERISGEPLDEGFETWAMRRGHELEPDARQAHMVAAGVYVKRVGIVLTDDHAFGASADGFIGKDGGAEYKCLVSPERLRTVLVDQDLAEFEDQIQGGMWLTGRAFWHFGLYCPALKAAGRAFSYWECRRDDNYIERMELELLEFKALVDRNEALLRSGAKAELKKAA